MQRTKVIRLVKILISLTILCNDFVLSTTFSFAKTIDTTTYNSYFPLHLGNKWIFQLNEPEPYNTYFTLSIDDTTLFDNRIYWKFIPRLFDDNDYYRIDSLGNFIQINNDKPILNFTMQVSDSIQIWYSSEYSDSGYTYCLSKDSVTTFIGKQGVQIEYFVDWSLKIIDDAQTIILQENVGPIGLNFTEHDSPMILKGAIINGVIYGDTTTTSVEYNKIKKANNFCLYQNYPNPFNSFTKIRFNIPNKSKVTLKVFNIIGEEIETIVDNRKMIGNCEVIWNSKNIPSGVYIYQIESEKYYESKKLILLK